MILLNNVGHHDPKGVDRPDHPAQHVDPQKGMT